MDIVTNRRVHIVRANALVDMLHGTVPYKYAVEQPTGQDVELQRDILHVRRFFCHQEVPFTVHEEMVMTSNKVGRCYHGAIPLRQRDL